jgi:ABC-2 type transport system permease protein
VSLGMILLFIVVLTAVALNLLRRGKGIRN